MLLDTSLEEQAELCLAQGEALPVLRAAKRPHAYQPVVAEPQTQPKMQFIPPNHGLVIVGEKKRAVVFCDYSSRDSTGKMRKTLALCERYHYDILVIDVTRKKEIDLSRDARDFLLFDRNVPLISLHSPQLNREHMLSWLFSANTSMALDVAKDGLRWMADSHADTPYAQKKLNRNTDLIAVSTHDRAVNDKAHSAMTAPFLIIAMNDDHVKQLQNTNGAAHAVVHGGHPHDCKAITEIAARLDNKVAVFHPEPPKRLTHAGTISLSQLRADKAVVVTNTPDMIRVLRDFSKPTGGAPSIAHRPGTRNGGMVHAAQFL
ncbi:MAG: hypothetical protein SFW65_10445 [Alphaproteobacteria bacterium]|nr:hypothetical protein [Alphaproteobacteria bacterium]